MHISCYQAIPKILAQIKSSNPKSILDVGIGYGKYGLLFRDILEIPLGIREKNDREVIIDGVELCEAYHNEVYDYVYDNVYFGNICNVVDTLPNYDYITLINVLEYFEKEEGLKLMRKLISHCNKGLIAVTPFYREHEHEELTSVWSLKDFEQFNYTYERVEIEENGVHIFNFKKNKKNKETLFDKLGCNHRELEKSLRIAYLLPHKNLTGGMKMLLQQMKYLKGRGHKIIACIKEDCTENSAIPDWFDLEIDEEIILPMGESFINHIPECDVVVAGWVTQLIEMEGSHIPVVYWEQGNEWLFGDIKDRRHISAIEQILERCYLTKHAILSVSSYVSAAIFARYGRKTAVLSNGIDTEFYCVGEKSNTNKILLVGNPFLSFKGFDAAFKALSLAWRAGYGFNVEWVCQTVPQIPNVPFPVLPIIKPSQEELAKLYQNADIHLFTSWYEGFGMPPLEAMSCGTAVVCTECGGVDAFVKNGYNALTADPGDITSLAADIAALLKFPLLREKLAANGRKTAESLDYTKTILDLEAYLYNIVL